MNLKKYIYPVLIIFSLCLKAQTLTQNELEKLHPQFRTIISEEVLNTNVKSSLPMINSFQKLSSGENLYGAIIYTSVPDALKSVGIIPNSILPQFVTAQVTAQELLKLSQLESIRFITPGYTEYPHNDIATGLVGADLLHTGYVNNTTYKGSSVIVCIIDTGIDWTHYDFRDPSDPTKSRIINIWDQTLTASGGETPPSGFAYGVEYTQAQIEDELDGTPAGFVREQDINGHGTHVAGTASGNGSSLSTNKYMGIAPEANILVVKAGNSSFTSTNLINALSYAQQKATTLEKPIVVNMSLGSDGGPHDGTDAKSAAINNFTGTGRVVVVSAGNSGGSNIHISGTIASGSTTNITLIVPSYSALSGNNNDNTGLDTWFDSNASVSVTVTSPNGYSQTQNAGGTVTTNTNDGTIYLYNYVDAGNSNREIDTYLYDAVSTKPPAAGTWTIALTNNSGNTVNFHSWLYDASIGSNGTVALTDGNTNYTLGNSAQNAIIVGSYVSRWRWTSSNGNSYWYGSPELSDNISSFSSKGPTRNNQQKPDVSAPGQAIISAKSKDTSPAAAYIVPGNLHLINQGTSMASPVVAGCVALLLQQNPNLIASGINSLITTTAYTDSYTGSSLPDHTWGYGKIDIYKALVKSIDPVIDNDWEMLSYDEWLSNTYSNISENTKIAVRFTPTFSGNIVGVFFHPYITADITSSLYAEIWSNSGGLPNSKLGNTVSFDQNKILKSSWNYINLTGTGASVDAGDDYYVVLYFTSGTGSGLDILEDNGSADSRSFINSGSGWSTLSNDLRIRPIVTKDISSLPVELYSFNVHFESNQFLLTWKTLTEKNSFGFEVERKNYSENNIQKSEWEKITFIKSNGNSNSPKEYSFIDYNISVADKYVYRLKMVDNDGEVQYSKEVEINFTTPNKFNLGQNFPNPFNPTTKIKYKIPSVGTRQGVFVQLKVYDILGNEIATLVNEEKPAGNYEVQFDGSKLSSGIYFYKIITPNFTDTKMMLLLK